MAAGFFSMPAILYTLNEVPFCSCECMLTRLWQNTENSGFVALFSYTLVGTADFPAWLNVIDSLSAVVFVNFANRQLFMKPIATLLTRVRLFGNPLDLIEFEKVRVETRYVLQVTSNSCLVPEAIAERSSAVGLCNLRAYRCYNRVGCVLLSETRCDCILCVGRRKLLSICEFHDNQLFISLTCGWLQYLFFSENLRSIMGMLHLPRLYSNFFCVGRLLGLGNDWWIAFTAACSVPTIDRNCLLCRVTCYTTRILCPFCCSCLQLDMAHNFVYSDVWHTSTHAADGNTTVVCHICAI